MDFGKVLEAKTEAKIDFWDVFFYAFFKCVPASILDRFLEAPNPENMHGAYTGAPFLQNRRFQKSSEKTSILVSFWEAKTIEKSRKRSVAKYDFFLYRCSCILW